jgi:hypothetical protein
MAEENPTCGYTRIRGALKNVGHRGGTVDDCQNPEVAGDSAGAPAADVVANISAGALGRDRGRGVLHDRSPDVARLVTYYTVFVIDLASRRVDIVGSTSHPHDVFMRQVARTLTAADDGLLVGHRVLICDRDAKWSAPVRERLGEAGIRVVQTPFQAPNANSANAIYDGRLRVRGALSR